MSDLKDSLTLHLALDDVQEKTPVRAVAAGINTVQTHGTAQLVADAFFGSAASFNGTDYFMDLPAAALPPGDKITVAFWAKIDDRPSLQNSIVAAVTGEGERILNVHLPWGDDIIYFDCGFGGGDYDRIYQPVSRAEIVGKWTHWTFTKNAESGAMKIYLNGKLWLNGTGKHRPLPAAAQFTLGADRGVNKFAGQLAQFRVFGDELAPEAIDRLIHGDRAAKAVVRKTHPLGFNLFDDDDQQALYITDHAEDHDLHLEIHNTSAASITLAAMDAKEPAADNRHFELKFRPGTLLFEKCHLIALGEVSYQEEPRKTEQWRIKSEKQPDGTVSLYFLSVEPIALEPDSRLKFTLCGVPVDGRGGARGTRIELKYGRLTYTGDSTEIKGNGIQHINIVNQRGRKNTPLHLAVTGSNTILNDGAHESEITLRIVNADKNNPLPLSRAADAPSKFILTFSEKLKPTVGVRFPGDDKDHPIEPTDQNESPEWIIENRTLERLGSGGHIDVRLSSIVTASPAGQIGLYVHYENIPGHWDGQLAAALEKSCLVQKDASVGIGTSNPAAKLHIAGSLRVDDSLSVKSSVGIGTNTPEARLQVIDTPQDANGKTLILGLTGSSNLRLGYHDDYAWIHSHSGKPLAINTLGNNVGIGTINPSAKLHVAGDVRFDTSLIVNDSIGIGTIDPSARLTIQADFNNALFVSGEMKDGRKRDGGIEFRHNNMTQGIGFGYNTIYATGSNDDQDLALQSRGSGHLLLNSFQGNVGIGTDSPSGKLQIINEPQDAQGSTLILGSTDSSNLRLGYHTDYTWIQSHGSKPLTINPLGNNVGIGTAKPEARLHVSGTTRFDGVLNVNSNVGIGTASPGVPLEVRGWGSVRMEKGFWFAFKDAQRNSNNPYDNSVSIYADGGIVSELAFYVTSDERIKKDLRKSDSAADLAILNRLEVTDYRYKDSINRGDRSKKGFIAQQVEAIFPGAVNRQTGVLPDIYRPAPIKDGWIELETNLKRGERVKLIAESGAENIHEIVEIAPGRFRADFAPDGTEVFVYGRETADFRTLDYDALAVLNVSATQQLKKETDEKVAFLQAACAELEAANKELARKLERLEATAVFGDKAPLKTI